MFQVALKGLGLETYNQVQSSYKGENFAQKILVEKSRIDITLGLSKEDYFGGNYY